jgi:uncharacterized membrane protein YdjX (TVP38/TMEM64 family)
LDYANNFTIYSKDIQMKAIKRFLPISIIVILIMIAYFVGFTSYLTWHNFEHVHQVAMDYVEKHPYSSPLIFMGIYITYASLALPGILLLTILGGLIFKLPLSTLYVVFSATIGGSILFLSTRRASENFLSDKAEILRKMEKGFQQNAAGYMLFLRIVPLFPYWVVNVASALFGIRFTTFIWTTFVGIIPCAFLLTQMGKSIMMMLESEAPWTLKSFLFTLHF